MNTAACEVDCSSPRSRSEDVKAEDTRKDIKFSYTREFLLSLAEIDACKSLPSGFDSSILFDLKNSSTSWFCSDPDFKRWDCNLSEDLPPENGHLGRGALLRKPEPEYVAGLNARKLQGGYLLLQKSELNNASTCSSQSSNYSEYGRWDGSTSQHLHLNPECGLLGRGSILQEPGCLAGLSSPRVQGSRYHLLNRSVAPYRPPHLYKMKDATDGKTNGSSKCPNLERREDKRIQRDSLEMMMEDHKPIKGKQQNVSEEHKENLDPDTQPEIPRTDKSILSKCYQTREVAVSSKSVEKIFQTKFLHHPSTQEHYNVEADQTKNTIDQFTEEEKKPTHGVSMSSEDYEPKVSIGPNRKAYENESTSVSSPRCGSLQKLMAPTAKVSEQSCSFATSIICLGDLRSEETEHSNALEGSESHLPRHQCMQSYDAQEQSNTASHSGSSQLLAMLKKGIDALVLSEAPSNLDSHSTRTTKNLGLDLTCGISMGNETNESEVYIEPNKNTNNCKSKSFSFGINASEVCISSTKISNEQESTDFSSQRIVLPQKDMAFTSLSVTENVSEPLCSSSTSASKVTKPSNASQVTEKHFSLDQCIEFHGLEKMHPNTTCHSGSSQQLLDFLKKEKDMADLEAAWSKLNCYNAYTIRNSDVGENHFSQHQCVEDHDVENMKSSPASYSGSYQDLLYLLKKGGKDATYLAAPQSKLNSSGANITGNLDVSENHFSHHQSVEYQDIENIQSSTSSHSVSSQHLLDSLKKGKDTADLAAAGSMQNSSDANISGNLDVSKNHFSQRQFVLCPDIKNVQSSTVCHPGSSQHHLDLLKKCEDETDPAAACSKLNSSIARTTGKLERNLICAMHEADLRKEVQLIPSAVPTEYDFLWHSDFPSPLNSKINLFNHENATSLSYGKQTDIDGIKGSGSISSEVDNRMEFDSPSEQKLEPIPVNGYDEKLDANDEICLPDEDSLITLNDLVFQMDSVLIAVGDSTDADLVASRTTATNAEKPAAFIVSSGDDRSPSSLGNATLASNAVVDSETPRDKMDASHSYPLSHTYHRKPLFHHSEVWSSASKIYPYGPFSSSVKHSLPQQIVTPVRFPQQIVYYYPWLNQDFTQNYEQQIYGTPNPGHHKPHWRKL